MLKKLLLASFVTLSWLHINNYALALDRESDVTLIARGRTIYSQLHNEWKESWNHNMETGIGALASFSQRGSITESEKKDLISSGLGAIIQPLRNWVAFNRTSIFEDPRVMLEGNSFFRRLGSRYRNTDQFMEEVIQEVWLQNQNLKNQMVVEMCCLAGILAYQNGVAGRPLDEGVVTRVREHTFSMAWNEKTHTFSNHVNFKLESVYHSSQS